jgi:hypothetical protein
LPSIEAAIWIWLLIACSLRGRLTVLNTFYLCLQKSIRVTHAPVAQAREAAFGAHAAARESSNSAAIAVARAAGHAVATAHMADHELGAAAYAIWAVMKSVSKIDVKQVAESECRWQQAQLSDAIRELVLSDQQNRNPKFKNVFSASPPAF